MPVARRLSAAAPTLPAAAAIAAGTAGPAGLHPASVPAAACAPSAGNPPPGRLIWDAV